jgi:hypothetical protein
MSPQITYFSLSCLKQLCKIGKNQAQCPIHLYISLTVSVQNTTINNLAIFILIYFYHFILPYLDTNIPLKNKLEILFPV